MDLDFGKIILDYTLEGRPSNVPFIALKFYIHNLMNLKSKQPNPNWLPSVR